MRKLILLFLGTCIILLTTWSHIYSSYLEVQGAITHYAAAGNFADAMARLKAFRNSPVAYPLEKIALFARFKSRLQYNEGVLHARLGDRANAAMAFNQAAQAKEPAIAATAFYNLAVDALDRSDLETARQFLSKALTLIPDDIEAKVNLELVIMKSRSGRNDDSDHEQKKQRQPTDKGRPGEQWRLDIPENEGQGGGTGTETSHL
jgi:tetratricopeptide (TPR) repeat protein